MSTSPTTAVVVEQPISAQPLRAHPAPLSARQAQVLQHMAWGYTNREIASILRLSVKTVETHKANGMRKLGLARRVDVVRYALQQHWLELDIASR